MQYQLHCKEVYELDAKRQPLASTVSWSALSQPEAFLALSALSNPGGQLYTPKQLLPSLGETKGGGTAQVAGDTSPDGKITCVVRSVANTKSLVAYVRASNKEEDVTAVQLCAHAGVLRTCSLRFGAVNQIYCLTVFEASGCCSSRVYRLFCDASGLWQRAVVSVHAGVEMEDAAKLRLLAHVDPAGNMLMVEVDKGACVATQITATGLVYRHLLVRTGVDVPIACAASPSTDSAFAWDLMVYGGDKLCHLKFRSRAATPSPLALPPSTNAPRKKIKSAYQPSASDLKKRIVLNEEHTNQIFASHPIWMIAWGGKADEDMLAKVSHEQVFEDLGQVKTYETRVILAKMVGQYRSEYDSKDKKELLGALIERVLLHTTTGEVGYPKNVFPSVQEYKSRLLMAVTAANQNMRTVMELKRRLRGDSEDAAAAIESKRDCEYITNQLARGAMDTDTKRQYYYVKTLDKPFLQALSSLFKDTGRNDFEQWSFKNFSQLYVLTCVMGVPGLPQLEAICRSPQNELKVLTKVPKLKHDPVTRVPTLAKLMTPAPGISLMLSKPAQQLLAFKLRNILILLNACGISSVNTRADNICIDLSDNFAVYIASMETAVNFFDHEREPLLTADLALLATNLQTAKLTHAAQFLGF